MWRSITWLELHGLARIVSAGLVRLGVEPKQMVSIVSNTRPEWCVADLGIVGAGATTVPIYQSNPPADIEAMAEALCRVGEIASQWRHEVAEIEINPLFVFPAGSGVIVGDVLAVLK